MTLNYATALRLPTRSAKPRENGLTIVIDNGVPTQYFQDVMQSMGHLIDFVKFGWGTSLVTRDLEMKIHCLREHQIDFFFGGTLFEKYYMQHQLDDYQLFCQSVGCHYVEISNGTVGLSNREKASWIREFAQNFRVFSEVGYKDTEKSINLRPAKWIEYIREDLEAGAWKVITEARETGTAGIVRPDGELRFGLMEEIFDAVDPKFMVYEAPNKTLQTYFISRLGPEVNLANISFHDPIPLETLRMGLRSDTLMLFEENDT
ncbi:phosphosulfolactate synthase [Ferroacidibacillus organovorans]|uniref:Phosphosulfolactate synthase n=1 Tax=Ferroacidibacillus organovorans TaxID=1765683 RepID=A0A1V4ERS7_9BACL|nr:phosphosulfolactate synthase [Ferroacidibacillus organovorans]OPG15627.1 phosphosulfolactate synthase [Ferroacidibacillus organovorans]